MRKKWNSSVISVLDNARLTNTFSKEDREYCDRVFEFQKIVSYDEMFLKFWILLSQYDKQFNEFVKKQS